jgi:hypothetical protein
VTDVVPIKTPEIIAEVGGLVDEARLTLGIYGSDLEPTEISNLLGCAPTSAHRRGDLRREGLTPWPQGAWLLSIEGKSPTGPDELVGLLLGRLPQNSAIWEQLRGEYSVRLSFGIFVVRWNSGFELSPTSINRLAAIGGQVGIDIYAEVDEANSGEGTR